MDMQNYSKDSKVNLWNIFLYVQLLWCSKSFLVSYWSLHQVFGHSAAVLREFSIS